MNFTVKLVVSLITISSTIVASIYGGFEVLDLRMDRKVKEGKEEVYHIMTTLRNERNTMLKAQDDKVTAQITALNTIMLETRKDIRTLLRIETNRERAVKAKAIRSDATLRAGTRGRESISIFN